MTRDPLAQATPRPWHVDSSSIQEWTPRQRDPFSDWGGGIEAGPEDDAITIIQGGAQDEQGGAVGILREADRALIVRAVNAHDELLAALKALVEKPGLMTMTGSSPEYAYTSGNYYIVPEVAIEQARALLEKISG